MNGYLLVLFLYALFLAGIGLLLSRKVLTSADFFVADRKLGPVLLFSTLLAANIGAGSTVGAAGLGYQLGLSAWWWVGSAGIGSLLLAFTVGPRIRDLAGRLGFFTVGDFLEYRYDRRVKGLVALLLWGGSLSILAGQLIVFAWLMEVVAGTSKEVGCLLGGAVVLAYFTAGGLKGTARINLLQLVVKAVGFLLAMPITVAALGGWAALKEGIAAQEIPVESYFSMLGIGPAGILGYVVLLVPSFIVSPGLLQKIYGARDSSTVRRGVAANAAALLCFSFFPVVLGMSAAVAFPGLENPELALPLIMTQLLPFWLGAVLLAAVFSAEISSADAVLFMLSTSLSRDLYQTFIDPSMKPEKLLPLSRRISVLAGVLGIGLAVLLPSVIAALSIFYSLLAVALTAPLLFGLYSRLRAGRLVPGAIVTAVAATAAVHFRTEGGGIGILSPTAVGILVSAILLLSGRLFGRGGAKSTESRWEENR